MSLLFLIVGAILVALAVSKLFPDLTVSKYVRVWSRAVWPTLSGLFGWLKPSPEKDESAVDEDKE